MRPFCAAILLVLTLAAAPVSAQGGASPSSGITSSETYSSPRPSNLLPRSIFDPSRLSISNSMVFGYSTGGYGYGGTAGLFTSSLGYQISNNTALHVAVGAHVNPAFGGNGTDKGIFLQSAAFDWRPTRNSLLRIEYNDMRSPLQPGYGYGGYGNGYNSGHGGWGTPYGSNFGQENQLGTGLPEDRLLN